MNQKGIGPRFPELSPQVHGIDVNHALPIAGEGLRIACCGLKNFKKGRMVSSRGPLPEPQLRESGLRFARGAQDFLNVHRVQISLSQLEGIVMRLPAMPLQGQI